MNVHKLLKDETVMPDDATVYPAYAYIIDNVFTRAEGLQLRSVQEYKARYGVKEIRRCSLFSHPGALLGDRVE